jgi:hypothetical protein
MDYKLILSGFLTGFVSERSKIGPLPLRVVNWLLVLVPGFLAYRALGQSNFPLLVGITIGALLLVVGYSTVLLAMRIARRQRFYKTVKHRLGLHSYSDYNKDSSKFVKVRWNLLHATRLSFGIVVSDVSMRTVKNSINDMNSMFPRPGWQWVIDLPLMTQGSFLAHAVPSESHEAKKFNAIMVMSDIAKDQLNYYDFPVPLTFVNEELGPKGFSFDEVLIERTEAKSVSRFSEERLLTLMNRTFESKNDRTWVIDQSDGSVFRFHQEHRSRDKARRHIHDIVNHHMSGNNVNAPEVTFENEKLVGDQFSFTSVSISGLTAQSLSEYKLESLYAALKTAFALPKGQQWEATMESDVLTITQVEHREIPIATPASAHTVESHNSASEDLEHEFDTPQAPNRPIPSQRLPSAPRPAGLPRPKAVPGLNPQRSSLPRAPRSARTSTKLGRPVLADEE